jgi:hypothetical protein
MFSILLTLGAAVGAGIIVPMVTSKSQTYGSQLEKYIVSNNPTDTADVERLTREYNQKSKGSYL